jgi:hypothetical protein
LLRGIEQAGCEADEGDASYHLTLTATEVFPTDVIRVIYSLTAGRQEEATGLTDGGPPGTLDSQPRPLPSRATESAT